MRQKGLKSSGALALLSAFTLMLAPPLAGAAPLDINARDRQGNTALIHAAANGHQDIVEQLMAQGVDTQVQNHQRETALSIAVARGHRGIVQLLAPRGTAGDVQSSAGGAPDRDYQGITELLIAKGAKIKPPDPSLANDDKASPTRRRLVNPPSAAVAENRLPAAPDRRVSEIPTAQSAAPQETGTVANSAADFIDVSSLSRGRANTGFSNQPSTGAPQNVTANTTGGAAYSASQTVAGQNFSGTGTAVSALANAAANMADGSTPSPGQANTGFSSQSSTGAPQTVTANTDPGSSLTQSQTTAVRNRVSGGTSALANANALANSTPGAADISQLAQEPGPASGPMVDPNSITHSMTNLAANATAISSVPKSLQEATAQMGGNSAIINPMDYVKDKPPVTAGSLGAKAQQLGSKENSESNMVGNLTTMIAARKGLQEMAGQFANPETLAVAGQGLQKMASQLVPPAVPGKPPASGEKAPNTAPDQAAGKAKEEKPKEEKPKKIKNLEKATSVAEEKAAEAEPAEEPSPAASKKKEKEKEKGKTKEKSGLGSVWLIVLGGGFAVILLLRWYIYGGQKDHETIIKFSYEKAQAAKLSGNFFKAQMILRELLEKYPRELDASYFLAEMLWRKLNQPREALDIYRDLEHKIRKQGIDYQYKTQLKQDIEELKQQLSPSTAKSAV